ncbi:MAG: ExbD/TolR family protein [Pirellulales bacterium]
MKIRHPKSTTEEDKVELQMTPMIDVVFQLLAFFLFTLRIASAEGDFNIKMPLAAPSMGTPDVNQLPPMKVRLLAGANGTLGGIKLGERPMANFEALRTAIRQLVGEARGPGSVAANAEVEFDCDYNLRYQYVISAITAVSGYVDQGGHIIKVVEKIKFSPPRAPGSGG